MKFYNIFEIPYEEGNYMCLAVPGKIVEIDDELKQLEAEISELEEEVEELLA